MFPSARAVRVSSKVSFVVECHHRFILRSLLPSDPPSVLIGQHLHDLSKGPYLNDVYKERGEGVLKMQMNADDGERGVDPL